ncbi:MAG: hypothetical protein WAO78_01060, partial [Roseovarius sp.]
NRYVEACYVCHSRLWLYTLYGKSSQGNGIRQGMPSKRLQGQFSVRAMLHQIQLCELTGIEML